MAKSDWSPPEIDKKTGHEMRGGYPVAGPARARALADAGKTSDPEGIISDDKIAAVAKPKKGDG